MRNSAALLTRLGINVNSLDVEAPPGSQTTDDDVESIISSSPNITNKRRAFKDDVGPPQKKNKVQEDSEAKERDVGNYDNESQSDKDEHELVMDFMEDESDDRIPDSDPDDSEETTARQSVPVEVRWREYKNYSICTECGIRVDNRNIKRHIRENHQNISFSCNMCKKTFKRKEYLAKHICRK